MIRTIAVAFMLSATGLISAGHVRAERPSKGGDPANSELSRAWQASYAAESAGNYEGALRALDQLPSALKQGYIANYRRGWLHYCLGHHKESVSAYDAAIAKEPDAVEARVARLLPLMAQAKWNEVIKGAQDTLKRDPQSYLALQRMAYAQFSTQHFPAAEQTYRRLVRLYPSDIEMRAALGWAVLRMGKQAEAVELFRAVLELSPQHASAAAGLQAATAPRSAAKF